MVKKSYMSNLMMSNIIRKEIVIAFHSKVSSSRLSLQVGTSGPSFSNRRTKYIYFLIKQDLLPWNHKMLSVVNFFPAAIIYYGFARNSIFYLHNEG